MSPRGVSVTSSPKSPFRKHLEKKHAFLFIEHWKEGKGHLIGSPSGNI